MKAGRLAAAMGAGLLMIGFGLADARLAVAADQPAATDQPAAPGGTAPAGATATPGGTAAAEEDPVVARLNGEDIRRSDALRYRNQLAAHLRDAPDEEVLPTLIDLLIDSRLVAAEARRAGLADDPEIRARVRYVTDYLLEREMLSRELSDKITDEAARAAYDAMGQDPVNRQQVRARHILLETREDAEAVIARLKDGGDFATLAEEHSIDPSAAERGGDLGFFVRDQMVEPFADAAFALEVGAYTPEPVQTQFGWHVIKVEEQGTREMPPFDDDMKQFLRRELAQHLRDEYVQSLRAKAVISTAE